MIKKVVLSMHDACPVFQKEIECVLQTIPQKKSFLITPLWHGKYGMDANFAELMQTQDTLLHGLTHMSTFIDPLSIVFINRQLSREFLYLTYEATRHKIALGVQLFKNHLGKHPTGFIAPMWYHTTHIMQVLNEMNFCYTETWRSFMNLRTGQRFTSFPLSLDYGNNTMLRTLYLKSWISYWTWNRPAFVRIAIHPSDIRNGMLPKLKEIVARLEDHEYTFVTYAELLDQPML